VRAAKFDALGLFLLPAQASTLAKNTHLPRVTLFGGDFMASPVPLHDANGALDGILFPNNVVNEEFIETYAKRFGNEAHIKFAAEGYDVSMLLAELVCSKAMQTSLKPTDVMELMAAAPLRRGAQGDTTFKVTPDGDRYFSAPVFTIIGRRSGFSIDR
jgi:hypothetical protein